MKIKNITYYLLLFVVFLSCKKEDTPLIVMNTNSNLLSQVIIDKQTSFEYLYNSANWISEERSKFDLAIHHYNEKNQLLSTDYYANYNVLSTDLKISAAAMNQPGWVSPDYANKGGTINYEYNNNGQLVKATYSTLSGSNQYSEFKYDSNNRIILQTLFCDNKETGHIDYKYDVLGNLTDEILYNLASPGVSELSTTIQYVFDNKQNPYKSASKLLTPGISTNQNNIIKETYTINSKDVQGTNNVQVTQNSYEYNSKGYPTSKNGNVQYIYK
jgi:hypothetical protein